MNLYTYLVHKYQASCMFFHYLVKFFGNIQLIQIVKRVNIVYKLDFTYNNSLIYSLELTFILCFKYIKMRL